MNRIVHAALSALLLLSGAVQAESSAESSSPPLVPYRAEYEVLQDGKPAGHASMELTYDGIGQWVFVTRTRGENGLAGAVGLDLVETSRFSFDPQQGALRCLSYHYRQKALWHSRERSVVFTPERNEILSRDRDREYRFPYRPDALDRQIVTLALAADLMQDKRGTLRYTIADRERIAEHEYAVSATETVKTPAGAFPALRIERDPTSEKRRNTMTLWLSPTLGFAPVRVVQSGNDGDFEMRLVKHEVSAGARP